MKSLGDGTQLVEAVTAKSLSSTFVIELAIRFYDKNLIRQEPNSSEFQHTKPFSIAIKLSLLELDYTNC